MIRVMVMLVIVLCTTHMLVYAGEDCALNPTAVITNSPTGTLFKTGISISFDGSSSKANNCSGYITNYKWTIGGTAYAFTTNPVQNHTFNLPNGVYSQTYQVTLWVKNNINLEHTKTITVTVKRHQKIYHVKDHLGSVRASVDEQGNVVSYNDYYPFGLVMPERSSNISNPNDSYKFTGYEEDDEAGLELYHANARLYDPVIGRFMQIDPLLEFASPYSYVGSNPTNLIDPTGMSSTTTDDYVAEKEAEWENVYGNANYFSESKSNRVTNTGSQNAESSSSQEKYNTKYGFKIDKRLLESYGKNPKTHEEWQKYQFQNMLGYLGEGLKVLFGKGGVLEYLDLTFELQSYKHGGAALEGASGITTFGKKGTVPENLFSGTRNITPDFNINETQMIVYLNPNQSNSQSKHTSYHELRHVLLTAILIMEEMEILKNQHAIYEFYMYETTPGLRSYNVDAVVLRKWIETLNNSK